jgi:acyl carrier protein
MIDMNIFVTFESCAFAVSYILHKNHLQIKKENVTAVARFKEDLDLDSLDAVEIVMLIEEEFNIEIPDSEADKILSVADAVAFVSSHPMAK